MLGSRSQAGVPGAVEVPVHVREVAKVLPDSPRHGGEPVHTVLMLPSVAALLPRSYGAHGRSVAMP